MTEIMHPCSRWGTVTFVCLLSRYFGEGGEDIPVRCYGQIGGDGHNILITKCYHFFSYFSPWHIYYPNSNSYIHLFDQVVSLIKFSPIY